MIEHTKNHDDIHGIIRRVTPNEQGLILLDTRFPTGVGGRTVRLLQLRLRRLPVQSVQAKKAEPQEQKTE